MAVGMDDVFKIKVSQHMRKRAANLAKNKLGFYYDKKGNLVEIGDDRVYKRYNYSKKKRWQKLYLGEMAEEACKEFMNTLDIDYICYNDDRTDDFRDDDPFDFKIEDLRIDLKSSKDNRNHGLEEILAKQHLVTPIDQTVKPVIFQAFISNSEKEVWLCCWATEDELKRDENIGYLHWQPGKYYLMKVRDCHPMKEFRGYLDTILKN